MVDAVATSIDEKVSIIMPAFNCSAFIEAAVESVFSQSYTNWELLICDDDSTDNTKEIIDSLAIADERVSVVINTEGTGAASARNSCLKVASGRYVAFLDSDDQWAEYKLELQVEALKKGAHFCLTDYYVMSEAGDIEGLINAPVSLNFRLMLLSNFIGCLTVMYDTQYFGKVVQPSLKKRNDYALWLKMLRSKPSANIVAVTQPLAYYRANSYGLSSNKIDALRYYWICIRKYGNVGLVQALCLVPVYLIIIFIKKKNPRLYKFILTLMGALI
ncbi:MAG: glycosyltransferase family 2 protein [Aequoribacter sp.]|uniref:glycosyltransferase family 2 protein n=1 Tax=Aequoribacter sp. TaxID=2847771 RepID=UPI003C57123F